jgi:hypothetical protein
MHWWRACNSNEPQHPATCAGFTYQDAGCNSAMNLSCVLHLLLLVLLLPAATVDLIAQNGFDFRLSQVAAYGNGLYFAGV